MSTSTDLGPARLELTVEPARVGRNELHLYLFDEATGAQYDAVEELEVGAELPDRDVGPLELEPQRAGPGHYVVPAADLGIRGDWELRVAARVSEFDAYEASVEVPIR